MKSMNYLNQNCEYGDCKQITETFIKVIKFIKVMSECTCLFCHKYSDYISDNIISSAITST